MAPARTRRVAPKCVLVVSADDGLRDQVGTWLGDAGFDVVMCPGPSAPRYVCVGLRGQECPLDRVADLTVLDLHPDDGSHRDQTGRARLVSLYRKGDRPVLVLADGVTDDYGAELAGTAVLERAAPRAMVLETVVEMLGARG